MSKALVLASMFVAPAGVLGAAGVVGLASCGNHGGSEQTSPQGPSPNDASGPDAPENTAPPDSSDPAPTTPPVPPDTFEDGVVDVVSVVDTTAERRPISPLVYGMNTVRGDLPPQDVLDGVSFVRRGADRANSYNWETNASNGSFATGWGNDMMLAGALANPSAPGELDRSIIAANIAAGRGTMVPFVMNDYVAGPPASNIPFTTPGWNINQYFRRVELVKPTPFAATPDLNDGVVYTDEHLDFLRHQFRTDIFAAGSSQVMVGTDNEPDLFDFNYPMLQRGSGAPIVDASGVVLGNRVTGNEFTADFLRFAQRVKQIAPNAPIVGPDHYHYDGWTSWHSTMPQYTDDGRWYMDDFLAEVRARSEAIGTRLLDTWDFHWYPQRVFGGTYTWAIDHAVRPMTEAEIEAVLQGPRSYWDPEFDEHSWITDDHLHGPATILTRLLNRVEAGYPGTKLGVTEYFTGGCAHVSSALATADSLGVFGRMGIHMAAMWPHKCDLTYPYGGFKLMRNADGKGLRFAGTSVKVDHPEKAPSSVYAASDDAHETTVLVINKTNERRRFGLRIVNGMQFTDVEVHRVEDGHADPYLATHEAVVKYNAYAYDAPPMSAALLVFRAR